MASITSAALIPWTVRIDNAFRSAGNERIATIVEWAFTFGLATNITALGVHSARRWIASGFRWSHYRSFTYIPTKHVIDTEPRLYIFILWIRYPKALLYY